MIGHVGERHGLVAAWFGQTARVGAVAPGYGMDRTDRSGYRRGARLRRGADGPQQDRRDIDHLDRLVG